MQVSRMIVDLVAFKTDVHRLHGVCAELRSAAHGLDLTAFELDLLAKNGLVSAAGLPAGRGSPLIALTRRLACAPPRFTTAVSELHDAASTLSTEVAGCSSLVTRYTQMGAAQQAAGDLELRRRESDPSPHLAPNIERMRSTSERLRAEIDTHLRRARLILMRSLDVVDEVRKVALETRHISACVRIESAHVDEEAERFSLLSSAIVETMTALETRQAGLASKARSGTQFLERLATAQHQFGAA